MVRPTSSSKPRPPLREINRYDKAFETAVPTMEADGVSRCRSDSRALESFAPRFVASLSQKGANQPGITE